MAITAMALVAMGVLWSALQPPQATTILVICPAETQSTPAGDPPLSVAGLHRARQLARFAADIPLDALYAPDLQRTLQTAQPLASSTGLRITPLPPDPQTLDQTIRRSHRGTAVAIVSRCDQATAIVASLLGEPAAGIAALDEATLYLVTRFRRRQANALRFHYGEVPAP
ncbi:MAG: histidine phosphatase family protein [Acidobacteriota bacterium]